MGVKERKAAAAARARALLGLDENERTNTPEPAARAGIPAPAGRKHGHVVERDERTVSPGPDSGLEGGRAEGEPGSKRRVVLVDAQVHASEDSGLSTPDPGTVRPIDPRHFPKVHPSGSLARGTSVWYRGERYYVEFCPSDWTNGCYARICDHRVHPDKNFVSGSDLCYRDEKGVGHGAVTSFCVHADLLSLAPTVQNPYARQPTLAGVARKERAARGERDVGDDVAVALREAKSLDDIYRIGAEYLSVQESELRDRYGHLNAGQQRMNVGNRMRALWRKTRS